MYKKTNLLFSLILALVLVLSACTGAPTTQPAAEPPAAPAATEAPLPTAAPTEAPAAAEELPAPSEGKLVLATTTSTEDSGLLDYILPDFEAEYGLEVDVIAVGTGQALKLGEDGNADVLLVHARASEDKFMDAGHGVRREDVMYNDFVIVGSPDDPAGIKGMTSAVEALQAIAAAEAAFVSRGDESGTHIKEKSVWSTAEIEPSGDWYISAGQGMGAVLTMADELKAYTLSDRATYLARTLEGTELVILVEGDPVLFNPYGIIAVNPEKNPNIQAELAQTFIDWLVSLPTQEKIATFGVAEFGAPLFTPDSNAWREAQGAAETGGEVALKITGKVAAEQAWSEDQVKALPTLDVEYTNKKGETDTYTGVLISELLKLAEPASDATTLVLVADDGFTAEIALADVLACLDCILAFREEGGFQAVMPGFPGNAQVKGVVELQVK
ncbi:MAG: substrate-binding domain-containing protein [Anaerolineales bacterium]|nr:substrate-binding domain-containing protein [Anaerolineales bacterium]